MKPHRCIFAAALTCVTLAWGQTTMIHSWTSAKGKVIQAKFIKLEGELVTLDVSGTQHKFPLTVLAPESAALAKKLAAESPAPAAAPPPASLSAATPPSPVQPVNPSGISPANLLGKTFEECEMILGKPIAAEDPAGEKRSFTRRYKPSEPGLSQITLVRQPQGSMNGPVPETVNGVTYCFPKGTMKTTGQAFKLIELGFAGAYEGYDKDLMGDEPLSPDSFTAFHGFPGKFRAFWIPAATSAKEPESYRHLDEDRLSVGSQVGLTPREMMDQVRGKFAVMQEFSDLNKNGAFGFPQASATVLADEQEARFSVWSNAEFLFVQIVVWADGDDALGKSVKGQDICDNSRLFLNLDVERTDGVITDRTYIIDPKPELHGLHYMLRGEKGVAPPLLPDSKGRGSIQFVPSGGKKLRVDSYLIPLAEIGKKAGDKIRLSLSGHSVTPKVSFNSAGLRDGSGLGVYLIAQKKSEYHDFTLGQQTGTIDPSLVPDGRDK